MIQLGFLDFSARLQRIDKAGDPLNKINTAINWEVFRPTLEKARYFKGVRVKLNQV